MENASGKRTSPSLNIVHSCTD